MTKDDILTAITEEYDISKDSLMGHCREQPLAEARQMAMYIFRQEVCMSMAEIARIFSRHHPTVAHGVRHIGELLTVDKCVRGHYERIMNELRKEA